MSDCMRTRLALHRGYRSTLVMVCILALRELAWFPTQWVRFKSQYLDKDAQLLYEVEQSHQATCKHLRRLGIQVLTAG